MWNEIDTVLLDMDGTLLDLHFDNHFWLEYVPSCYAKREAISVEEAKLFLSNRYAKISGTLDWYCVDYWSNDLDMDIAALKEEVSHLINVLPHVEVFLRWLKQENKKRVLITNAHQKSLQLKMRKTKLNQHLDIIISAHDLGYAKEDQNFWRALQKQEPFDKERTLFIDDSFSVLASAKKFGIKYLLAISKPDSKKGVNEQSEFKSVMNFSELKL